MLNSFLFIAILCALVAGSVDPNGQKTNGMKTNGVAANGQKTNGVDANGQKSNGVDANGQKANGVDANGQKSNGVVYISMDFFDIQINGANMSGISFINGTGWDSWSFANASLGTLPLQYMEINANLTDNLLPLLHYLVSCALLTGDTWEPVLSNGTTVSYMGFLGLAPNYLSLPLNDEEEQWMSACMLAHVNAFGRHVEISVRNAQRVPIDTIEEEEDFQLYEGGFFGNVFATQQTAYSCQGIPEQQALPESPDRQYRVCTDVGHPNCPYSVGYCADYCTNYVREYGYSECTVNGTTFNMVINTYLRTSSVGGMVPTLLAFLVSALLAFA